MRFKGIALRAFIYSILLFKNNISLAEINTRTGEFYWNYKFFFNGKYENLTYSSRSTHKGIFGAGWCSSLDYEKTAVGVYHCGRKIRNSPTDLSEKLKSKTAILNGNRYVKSIPISNIKLLYSDDRLIEIDDSNHSPITFQYDEFHNMTRLKNSNQAGLTISYDTDNDRVLEAKSKDCKETVEYKQTAKKRWISYRKQCEQKLIYSQIYEITYDQTASGEIYIKEVKLKSTDKSSQIEYSESGEILHINFTREKEST